VEIFMRSDDQQKVVQIAHVKQAILEMTKSSLVVSIERCSFQQLLFLLACVKRNRQCGIKELVFCDVVQEHIRYCREYSKNCPNISEFHRISSFLGSYHLIIVESIKAGEPSQKLQLQIHEQDIFLAVKNCQDSTLLAIVKKLDS
jgi:Cdc6-like AAA superfamily ATPase